jgi:trehalose/maltose hydrolase-like predicted phosphorylase
MMQALEPTQDPSWVLTHKGYNVLTENAVESRFALGNGFLGMRASRPVSRGPSWVSWQGFVRWASWPRCYVAGLFDRPNTVPPVPALVPIADWPRVRLVLDDNPQLMMDGEFLSSVRRLDMRRRTYFAPERLRGRTMCLADGRVHHRRKWFRPSAGRQRRPWPR